MQLETNKGWKFEIYDSLINLEDMMWRLDTEIAQDLTHIESFKGLIIQVQSRILLARVGKEEEGDQLVQSYRGLEETEYQCPAA